VLFRGTHLEEGPDFGMEISLLFVGILIMLLRIHLSFVSNVVLDLSAF
jgi:hypothetical protein